MSRRSVSGALALVLLVSVVFVIGVFPLVAAPSLSELAVCTHSAYQTSPEVSGDIVVWSDLRNGNTDIYGYDFSKGTEFYVCNHPISQNEIDISGDFVVWRDSRNGGADIFGFDLSRLVLWSICTNSAAQFTPSVSGDIVVWYDYRNGNADIYGYDLRTASEFPICTNTADQYYPDIWGDLVVWTDMRNGNADIYGYRLSTAQTVAICTNSAYQDNPAVSKDLVVWRDLRDSSANIYGYDLSADEECPVCTHTSAQESPTVWGDLPVWSDYRNGNADIYAADLELDPTRASGANRYETAIAISKAHPTFSKKVVILATGSDFPDALAASGLAGVYHAPLLLTTPDSLAPAVKTEIDRIDPEKVVIIGGTGAVSDAVRAQLEGDGYTVQRIGGVNRYETAKFIAAEIESKLGTRTPGAAFVVRGDAFPDALAASPVAYNRKIPILLTPTDHLSQAAEDSLGILDTNTAVIIGGTGAVSQDVEDEIQAWFNVHGGCGVLRWDGVDRYATCATVGREAKNRRWAGAGFVGLATGEDFPDALAGGISCGQEYGVLMLTRPTSLPDATKSFLTDHKVGISELEVFGGTGVVSQTVVDSAKEAVD